MSKAAPAVLHDVAAVVLRWGLGGTAFVAAVESTAGRYGREPPEAVRRFAATVRFRHPRACTIALAELLEAEAERLEGNHGLAEEQR